MKKNYLFGLLSLFTLLFAASCQEDELAGGQMGDTATVTFQVNTPMLATRAVGDGETAKKLYVGIYEYGGNKADGALVGPLPASHLGIDGFASTIPFEAKKATVTLQLAKDKKYSVIFWAETENNSDAIFNMDWDNRKLTLKDNLKANQESYDAFWKQIDVTLTGAFSETVELTRPFAQLNIGTSDKAAAEKVGLVVSQSQVVVNGVYNTFDLQTGNATGEANVTYTMESIAAIKDQTFPAITDPKQEYIALNYLLMANDPSTVDVAFSYTDADDADPYNLNFTSVPLRRNYRTNIYGTLLTNSANYTVEIKPGFGNDGEEDAGNIVYVTTQEDFEKALKRNDENIVINLMPTQQKAATRAAGNPNEFKIYVGAWTEKYYFGGVDTDSITINANGCTINFVHENGDWNYIRCVNDAAKWIINDAHLTNSGKNDGPWNRHDIRFYNAVELNNVTSDKAIAVLNDGKLTNVAISEEGDVYGLWITAEGQKVELYNCTFKTAGRGIAIKDEYVDNPALVELKVENTKFNTEKKAAILVTSTAGANISLKNVDLSGVKADGFNAVWVDEDRAQYADLVTVTGGFCVVEDATPTAENNPFLVENGEVNLPAGTFVMPTAVANGVTIIGAEDGTTVLDMTGANPSNKKDLTFQNVTINVGNEIYHGMAHTSGLTYDNCVINGTLFLYSTAVFNNCTFNVEDDNYNVWTYGSTEATFNECTFNCDGKSVLVYNEGHNGSVITMNTCQFFARAAVEGKAAVEIDSSLLPEGMTYVVNLNGCTVQGFGLGSVSNEMLFNQKKGSKATIYVDGYEVIAEGVSAKDNNYNVWSAKGMSYFSEKSWEGISLNLLNDIDFAGAEFKAIVAARSGELTINGNGHTVKNVKVISGSNDNTTGQASFFYAYPGSKLTVNNLKFDNVEVDAEINGSGYAGVVVGYAEGNVVLNNVDINKANVYGEKSCGALVGFAPAGSTLSMTNCDVTYSKVEAKEDRTGAYIGRAVGNTAIVTCSVDDNFVSVAPEGYANKYIGQRYISCASLTIDGKQYVDTYYGLKNAIAENASLLLAPGAYEGTYAMLNGVTIESFDDKNIAIVDCINLNGADNITLKNIQFDAAGAQVAYDGKGNQRYYGNIISGGANKKGTNGLVIDGCVFTGTFANGGTTIAFNDQGRTSGQSGNITIKNCTFETVGGYVDIYTYYSGKGDLIIENNTFNSTVVDRPIYLGRYQSSTPVVVKGNAFMKVANIEAAVYLQDHGSYGVSYQAENNTFAQ